MNSDTVTFCNIVTHRNENSSSGEIKKTVTNGDMPLHTSLKNLRLSAGLTQEALAKRMGWGRAFLSLLESGKRNPSLEQAENWVEACGARLVIQRDGEELAALGEEERIIVEAWRRLLEDPGRQAILLEVARVLERLEPQSLAMLAGLLQAARGDASSSSENKRNVV